MKKKSGSSQRREAKTDQPTMVQTALWLPRDVHEQLKSLGGERGLGEEIRRRLVSSFETERSEQTRALTVPLAEIVGLVNDYFGDWRKDAFAFESLRHAVNVIVSRAKPPGDPIRHFNPASIADIIFAKTDTPEKVGSVIAGLALALLEQKTKAS